MFYEVKIITAQGQLKQVVTTKNLSQRHWDLFKNKKVQGDWDIFEKKHVPRKRPKSIPANETIPANHI